MRKIIIIILALACASSAAAQTVGQGAPGPDPWPVTSAPAPDQTATGTITSNTCPGTGCVSLTLSGAGGGQIDVTIGTFVGGALFFEGTADGTNWRKLDATYYNFSFTGREVKHACCSGLTGDPIFQFNGAGLVGVRVRAASYTSGTATVTIRVSSAGAVSNVVASQGLPNPAGLPWWIAATSLPLPGGASTDTLQTSEITAINNLIAELQLKADLTETQPVSLASVPLPTGASTSALQTTANSSLSSIDGKTPALVSGRQPVDGSGVIQPISAATLEQQQQSVQLDTSTTPLGISGVYTSAWFNVLNAGRVFVTVFADQNGVPLQGLELQWSSDGVNVDTVDDFNVVANVGVAAAFTPKAKNIRVKYTNGTVAQGLFRLFTFAGRAVPTFTNGQSFEIVGDIPHSVADGGTAPPSNPVKIGCRAQTAFTAVANNARTDIRCDTFGRLTTTASPSYSPMTYSSPTTATVGVASAQILASNASRRGLIIVNVSTAKVCFGIGFTAVVNSGICLQPDAVFNMTEFTLTTAAINAIASAAASVLSIQELQ